VTSARDSSHGAAFAGIMIPGITSATTRKGGRDVNCVARTNTDAPSSCERPVW
jgi:hypothetical protein